MNNLHTVSDKVIRELLAETQVDQVTISNIVGSILFEHATRSLPNIHTEADIVQKLLKHETPPFDIRTTVIDAIRRLLKHSEVVAVIRTPFNGTQVWDFEAGKVLTLLEKHWDSFKGFPTDPEAYDFMLHSRDAIPQFQRYLSKPIVIFKEPPSEFA